MNLSVTLDQGSALYDLLAMRGILVRSLLDLPIGLGTVAIIGEVMTADARFNMWYGTDAKRLLVEAKILSLLEDYVALVESCRQGYAAVAAKAPARRTCSMTHCAPAEIASRASHPVMHEPQKRHPGA